MVEAMARFGLDANMPVVPLTIDAPLEERLAYADMCEAGIGAVLDAFASGVPDAEGVTTTTTTITGEDGNDVTLYVSRPDVEGPLPAVVHLHGAAWPSPAPPIRCTPEFVSTSRGPASSSSASNSAIRGKAWPAYVSGRIERLRVGCAVGRGASRRTRREPSDRLWRVGRRQSHSHGGAQGQTRRVVARDRRVLRAMPVHLEPMA